MPVTLPFGPIHLSVDVAADPILPPPAVPVPDEIAAVQQALENPIGAPPLAAIVRPGETVAILVNDFTRLSRTELMLPQVVNALNRAGIPDGDIFVVFALGTHRPQSDEERRRLIGAEMFRRLRVYDHDANDAAGLVTLGTTSFGNTIEISRRVWEADRIILTGDIVYHQIAGYSGGRKSLLPGVAGLRSITFNHSMIFHPRCRAGILDGNPAHEDMLEACRRIDPDFLLNLVLSPSGAVLGVVAGHFERAHREGCAAVDELLAVGAAEPYDFLVASSGGHPLDVDLRQAHKGMENACRALRPGGTLFYYAECPNGSGSPKFDDFVWRYADDMEMERALRERFIIGGHKAYWVARMGRLFDVHLVSTLDPAFVERCHFKHVPLERHEARLRELLARRGGRVGVMPYAGFTMPRVAKFQEAVP